MSRCGFCLLNCHLVFFAILVATWDCRLIEQALSFKDGLNSILVAGLGLCESWLPLGYVMAHVKDLEWSPWRQEGRCFPPTHPCVLEPPFKSPRVLSSVTFGQKCHLSLALRRLARDWLSCAPAIPGSQALCSQGHRAGGKVGWRRIWGSSVSQAMLFPQHKPLGTGSLQTVGGPQTRMFWVTQDFQNFRIISL